MNPVVGLFSTFFSILVVLPLWFYILYSVLTKVEVGGAVWMAFAVYIVSRVILGIVAGVGQALAEEN